MNRHRWIRIICAATAVLAAAVLFGAFLAACGRDARQNRPARLKVITEKDRRELAAAASSEASSGKPDLLTEEPKNVFPGRTSSLTGIPEETSASGEEGTDGEPEETTSSCESTEEVAAEDAS